MRNAERSVVIGLNVLSAGQSSLPSENCTAANPMARPQTITQSISLSGMAVVAIVAFCMAAMPSYSAGNDPDPAIRAAIDIVESPDTANSRVGLNQYGKDIQDLNEYGRDVLEIIAQLATEEATNRGHAGLPEGTLYGLRIALARFLEASEYLGLDVEITAQLLDELHGAEFRGAIPVALRTATGGLETRALIESAHKFRMLTASAAEEATYLHPVRADGNRLIPDITLISARQITESSRPLQPKAWSRSARQPDEYAAQEAENILSRVWHEDGARHLTTQSGDTLSLIAKSIYGDVLMYRELFEQNRKLLASPNQLPAGVTLVLPPT